ncbi:biotin transporter BioY [uncultured Acetatifactor sp.]|jgi:biotin transport system substrate-specific component|uniref:biotin transporter BioY n=1 Tax=uncultured Acetatifactor sp. TaxID=1671927 RepID=UPI002632CBD4|nr:biotin transporter BioY [uncultured Acetatifactor sp.]
MNRFLPNLLGMLLGTAIGYLFGTVWLAYQQSIGFTEALFLGVVPYLGFDAVKLVLGMALGSQVRKRLLQAGLL